MNNLKKWLAEFVGTFWLTLGGCGSAVLVAAFPGLGIGLLSASLAFGLTVLTGAYVFGRISGGHFNPAVSIGLVVGKRFSASELPGYIISQVLGVIAAAAMLYLIVSGKGDFKGLGGFARDGFVVNSTGGFNMMSVFVTDVMIAAGFGGLAIGLCLTLIQLVSIPVVSNTSVNPARSTGPALFELTDTMGDLWLFWVAPIVSAVIVIGAVVYTALWPDD